MTLAPTAFVEALPYPTALYDAGGTLDAANTAFHTVIANAMPEGGYDVGHIAALSKTLGLGLNLDQMEPGKSVETLSRNGHLLAFTMTPIATGGWTLCVEDITSRRRAERKAERSQKIAIIALADLAENRDNETGEHVLRVARLTHDIAMRLKAGGHYGDIIDERFLRYVGVASILHDVGKVAIPDSILQKPGPLTPEERTIMEKHAPKGGAILRKADAMLAGSHQFKLAAQIAEFHHERWNGKGYPSGLAQNEIPLAARIVAVADVLDALTSARPYKAAWPMEQALDFIRSRSGEDFDPLVVQAMDQVLDARSSTITIEWTKAMATGEASIDHDHRILLTLVNQIWCPGTADDPIAVEFVLDELLGYTAFHFAREEELMARASYPDLDEHKATHKAMIAEVRDLQRRLTTFTPNLGMELQSFLGDWLTNHILAEDRRYIPYLWSETREVDAAL